MMTSLRLRLPQFLISAGLALAVLLLLIALLSYREPLTAAVLVLTGLAAGGIVAGFGFLLQYAADIAAAVRSLRQDVRAQTEATLALAAAVRTSTDRGAE